MEKISSYIATGLRHVIEAYEKKESLTEIRMRIGKPLIINTVYGEIMPEEYGKQIIVTARDIRETMEYVSSYSLYAYEDDIKNGYITMPGGNRVGVCGKTVCENGLVKTIRNISCINIRAAHEIIGCGREPLKYIMDENGQIMHTLIASAPGCGKTTILRDIVRLVSDGGKTVAVADERSEIAACNLGIPQNDVGIRTDVLDGCPKSSGMMMLIRSMKPDVIAVDEIGGQSDIDALNYVINCGCRIIATAHATSYEELEKKNLASLFNRIIILKCGHRGVIHKVYNSEGVAI